MFLRYLTDQGLIACFLDKTVYEGKELGISSSEEMNLLRIGRLYQLGRMHPNFRGFTLSEFIMLSLVFLSKS